MGVVRFGPLADTLLTKIASADGEMPRPTTGMMFGCAVASAWSMVWPAGPLRQ